MNWREEHKRKISKFPEDIRIAHEHCSYHRDEFEGSEVCGCFYCCSIFQPGEIKDWIDENSEGIGQCALCPHCGIDSIIGSLSGYPIEKKFL